MNIQRIFDDDANLSLDEILSSIIKNVSDSIINDFFYSLNIEVSNITIKGDEE